MNYQSKTLHSLLLIIILSFNLCLSVQAQSLQIPGSTPAGKVVITNAVIHPLDQPTIHHGYVAFENGIITAVSSGEYQPPPGTSSTILNIEGKHLYPGLINAGTTLGLIEIGAVRATNDRREVGNLTPEVSALTAINPDTALIPVTRANGILTALVTPTGGIVSGYASLINLDGWTNEDLEINQRAGLVIRWPALRPGSQTSTPEGREKFLKTAAENLAQLDKLFDDAAAYQALRLNPAANHPLDLRLESLLPALNNEIPLYIYANAAPQIRSAVTWCRRRNLENFIIVGAREADRCLDLLTKYNVPLIVGSTHHNPRKRDSNYAEAFTLPNTLHQAGLRFCIAGGLGNAANARNLPYHAATAAAYGLPIETALSAITINAARILGLGEQLGSITVGKHANLIITDGNPLEITTNTHYAFIKGKPVDLNSKHQSLNRKYRQRYNQK